MKQALRLGLLLGCLAGVTLPAWGAPSIDFGLTPALPGYLQNPGGWLSAWCSVDPDGTTPAMLRIRLLNEADEEILLQEFPNSTYYYLSWYVPDNANDGIYHYVVDYVSQEGVTAEIQAGFLVAGRTTGLCAFKFIDEDGDGIFDEGVESLASGWEICLTGPITGCKTTDADGAACWFFIPSGAYQVCETLQPGYVPTTPPCQDVVISSNVIGKAIFGNKVAPPTGACCAPDGSCSIFTESDCLAQGGTYYGDGSTCDPNPCPPPVGACCLEGGTCIVMSEEICLGQGGIYYGNGTVCEPNPCPPPVGACCLITGECIVTTADDCAAQNGSYQGDGVGCDPDPCPPPVPTEHTTWGRMKRLYR